LTFHKPAIQRRPLVACVVAVSTVLFGAAVAKGQVPLSTTTPYTQSFDGIGTSSTAVLPDSFRVDRIAAARTLGTYAAAGTATTQVGGANVSATAANGIYNFGAGTTSTGADRSIGFISSGSGTGSGNLYVQLTNNTGAALNGLQISYNVEKYRNGSNPAGYRYQLFYSPDGVIWTSAGADFLTAFPADANNSGFASAPGATVAVTDKILTVNIPSGASIYLDWNFSVVTGTTTTNSQVLAIDDIAILGVGAGGGTSNPSATGDAITLTAGGTATFSGMIAPGSNPDSQSYSVTCNLTSIGGTNNFPLSVSGTNISGSYVLPVDVAPNTYGVPCTITDNQSRSGNFAFSVTVKAPPLVCAGSKSLIGTIQGTGDSSPIVGQTVTIEGVVTGDYQGSAALNGFYVQDEGDSNPASSDGIFVNEAVGGSQGPVNPGDRVRLRGTVAEVFGQTAINSVTAMINCGAGTVTPVDVTFPVATSTSLEAYEGMLVRFQQPLRVTDNFDLGRFGELSLAVVPNYVPGVNFTRLMVGTQIAAPGPDANAISDLNNRSRIVLDNGSNLTYGNLPPAATWPIDNGGLAWNNTLRLGELINVDAEGNYMPVVGVLGFDFSAYRLHPVAGKPITFNQNANPRPTAALSVGGRVKVMSANVLNFFIDYQNNASNSPYRGADDSAEFQRQRDKLISAFKAADPAVIAISELQNNSTNPDGPLEDLVNDSVNHFGNSLNSGDPGKWAYISTGKVGSDAIRVGFIYQPALVQPVGSFAVLDNTVDPRALTERNRPSVAQTFKRIGGNKSELQHFTVVANHFKSKGSVCTSAPNDPDTGDGQGNCNLSRVSMAQALIDWLTTNPTGDPTPKAERRILIVGDLNTYLKEDPIAALTNTSFNKAPTADFPSGFPVDPNAIYKELVASLGDKAGYSYLFGGESGALDHALANPSLFNLITGVSEWHINADEPVVLDYNSDFDGNGSAGNTQQKSAAQLASYYNPGAFRTSDHDPLLIGFNPLPGDLNDDGAVDESDLSIVVKAIGRPPNTVDRRTDYDGDGKITLKDLIRWRVYALAYQR